MTNKLVLICSGLVLTACGWWFVGALMVILGFQFPGDDDWKAA